MTSARLALVAAAAAVVLPGAAGAANAPKTFASVAAEHARGGFAGVVLVDVGGRPVFRHAYGLADRRARRPNTLATVFSVGSFAKDYTAAAVGRLVEGGKLSLGAKLGDLLAGVPSDKAGITVTQLLAHRSGLPQVFGPDHAQVGREEALGRILALPLLFRPGRAERYSDVGYTLLAAIVEKVSGESFTAFVEREVFARAGMPSGGFWGSSWPADRVAVGYGDLVHGANTPRAWRTSWSILGAGETAMTVRDLVRFQRAYRAGRVVSRRSVARLERARFGTRVGGPQPAVLSGADAFGFNAALAEFGGKDAYIAVITNTNRIGEERADALTVALMPVLAKRLGVRLGPRRG